MSLMILDLRQQNALHKLALGQKLLSGNKATTIFYTKKNCAINLGREPFKSEKILKINNLHL